MKKALLDVFDAETSAIMNSADRLFAAETLGRVGDPRLDQENWVTIEAGVFLMGSQKQNVRAPNFDPEAEIIECPVHEVYLDSYQLGRYPVTVREYQRPRPSRTAVVSRCSSRSEAGQSNLSSTTKARISLPSATARSHSSQVILL